MTRRGRKTGEDAIQFFINSHDGQPGHRAFWACSCDFGATLMEICIWWRKKLKGIEQ